MNKIIFLLILLFPTFTFGQAYMGNYRAIFFNLFAEPRTIIAEFEVKTDNSIVGKVKVGDEVKVFNGSVDKKGKFEALSQGEGNTVYKLKGKFDKDNKISFIQRVQVGSGLNKSVSENGFEGSFAKVAQIVNQSSNASIDLPKVELIDNGKSWIKLQHSNPLFGNDWLDLTANITFSSSVQKMMVKQDSADSFNLVLKSKTEGQQRLSIATRNYSQAQKLWKANDLRYISYREESGSNRNSFMAGATMETDPFFAGGMLEIVKENETQIVFKLSNFKIKRFAKQDFVVLNGFIYSDK
ncbi:MAG: hypothetical protein AAB336_03155 [Acidobacteriota bacterium]